MTARAFAWNCGGLLVRSILAAGPPLSWDCISQVSASVPNPDPVYCSNSRRESLGWVIEVLLYVEKFVGIQQHPAKTRQGAERSFFGGHFAARVTLCLALQKSDGL